MCAGRAVLLTHISGHPSAIGRAWDRESSSVKDGQRRSTTVPRLLFDNGLAAWRSGNGVGRINEVTLRQARLVLGWVTCTGSTPGGGTLFRYVTSQPDRLRISSFRGR